MNNSDSYTTETLPRLISMADIARLAEESRATVGNWKRRYADFPQEQGRNARGPLYDVAEVQAWLSTHKDTPERSDDDLLWRFSDVVRSAGISDPLPVALAMIAAHKVGGDAWTEFVNGPSIASGDQLLRALPQLGNDERNVLRSNLVRESPKAIQMVARMIAANDSDRSLETHASQVIDTYMRLSHRDLADATPSSVIDLMVGLAAPHGVLYDPCLGTGRLLAQAVRAAASEHDVSRTFGQEISPEQALIAQLYFIISGVDAAIAVGDVFRHDAYPELAADCIVADPPLGVAVRPETISHDDPRWLYGDPHPSDATSAWIQHSVYHLAPEARAVMLVPNSALGGTGRGRVLQRIIRADLIDAVISLPSGALDSTRIPTALLVLQRDRPHGVRQGTPGPVLMIDIQHDVQDRKGVAPLKATTVKTVIDQYEAWSKKAALPAGPPTAVVSYDELAANDFVIDPRRYTMPPLLELAPGDLKQKREALVAELVVLLEECRVVDEALRDSLQGGQS